MSKQQRNHLVNLNRLLVLTFTLLGLSMDGYQNADFPTTAALVVWLWMPTCTALEENIFNYFSNEHSKQRPMAMPALLPTHEE